MQSITSLLGDPTQFLDSIFVKLAKDEIDVSTYQLDHFCYRVETNERYQELRKKLLSHNELLSDATIANRPISTFLLTEPFPYQDRIINCLELPAPKAIPDYTEGWEHVEFVIPEDFDTFMQKYPNVLFNTNGMTKACNPDIRIDYKPHAVKFHQHTLEYVVKYLQ